MPRPRLLHSEEVPRDAPGEDEGEDGPGEGGTAREARAGDAEREERERGGQRGVETQRIGETAVQCGVERARRAAPGALPAREREDRAARKGRRPGRVEEVERRDAERKKDGARDHDGAPGARVGDLEPFGEAGEARHGGALRARSAARRRDAPAAAPSPRRPSGRTPRWSCACRARARRTGCRA